MNAAEEYLAETSQQDLAAGVLKQAAQDLRRFHGATTTVERELYLDAYSWIVSEDCEWPFSFLNVCRLLNLAPEVLRLELLTDASVGPFRYAFRRCARAARSVQAFLDRALSPKPNTIAVHPVPRTVHAF